MINKKKKEKIIACIYVYFCIISIFFFPSIDFRRKIINVFSHKFHRWAVQSEVYDDKNDLKAIFRERRSFSVACALCCCACKSKDSRQFWTRRIFRRCFLKYDTVWIFINPDQGSRPFDKELLWISVWNEQKGFVYYFEQQRITLFFNHHSLFSPFDRRFLIFLLSLLHFLSDNLFSRIKNNHSIL